MVIMMVVCGDDDNGGSNDAVVDVLTVDICRPLISQTVMGSICNKCAISSEVKGNGCSVYIGTL